MRIGDDCSAALGFQVCPSNNLNAVNRKAGCFQEKQAIKPNQRQPAQAQSFRCRQLQMPAKAASASTHGRKEQNRARQHARTSDIEQQRQEPHGVGLGLKRRRSEADVRHQLQGPHANAARQHFEVPARGSALEAFRGVSAKRKRAQAFVQKWHATISEATVQAVSFAENNQSARTERNRPNPASFGQKNHYST